MVYLFFYASCLVPHAKAYASIPLVQGLPQVLLPRMLDVKDRLLMPALAAGEESVVNGIATLMAELGQAVQNRASLFPLCHQCIIATLGVNFFHKFCKLFANYQHRDL
jgi:hypothetical protein